jgi:rhodanese-related sulfurtransferase
MTPFPLDLPVLLGHWGQYGLALLIGFGFGFVLESAGFGNSAKLAGQFYFRDLTVLKVMFGAIVTAMVLVFAATGLGLLDYSLVWVNPTYLWPGLVGGLIMGVGFIVGGFCPGTSLVALATFKLDGLFFVLGGLFGIFLFGETVDSFAGFWNSSFLGRLTLPAWLGLPVGVVVVGIVVMALFMFWGGEQLERLFGGKDLKREPRWRYAAAGGLVVGALALVVIGQPTTADKWQALAPTKAALLADRAVQIPPAELLAAVHNDDMKVILLDVRGEADYNLFHLAGAERVPLGALPARVPALLLEPANAVIVTMGNDETAATEAWKRLTAESVPNVYILAGGLNHWLATFAPADPTLHLAVASVGDDHLRYEFAQALGARSPAATPDPERFSVEYTPKIQLKLKKGPAGGGCG